MATTELSLDIWLGFLNRLYFKIFEPLQKPSDMAVPPVQANAFTTSMATCFPSPIILLAIAKKVMMLKLSTQPMLLTTIAIAHLSFVPSMLLLTSRTKTKSIAKAHHRLTDQNHILLVPVIFWRVVSLHLSFLCL